MIMRSITFALLAVLVAACSGGEKIEAIYEVSALQSPSVAGATSAQILVPEPAALAAFATNRMPVKPTPITVSYYPAVTLQDTVPKVMQRVLLDTFQNSGRVRAVGLPGQSLLINYQVVTEVRAFQAETFDGDRARIEVFAKLLNDTNGRVISSRVFVTTVPMPGDDAEDAAIGLNQAAQALSTDVVDWTLRSI